MMQPIKGKGYKPGGVLFAEGTTRAKLREWCGFACADVDGGFAKFVVDELSPGVAKLNRDGEATCRHRRGT